jgi:hypothetical protein
MQFMVFMIPAGYQPRNGKQQEFKPDPKRMVAMMEAMGKFNDEIRKVTKVHALDGFAPLAKGARLAFAGGKPTVTDGPAIEAKEVVGGYWLVDAKSKEQVIDWWKRCPAEDGDVIEIRPIADLSDFPPEVRKALGEQGTGKEQGAGSMERGGPGKAKAPETGTKGPFRKSRNARSKEQD